MYNDSTLAPKRHFPKIRGGRPIPEWFIKHTDNNTHHLGPTPQVLDEWAAAGLQLPDLSRMRRYRVARVREQLRQHQCDGALLYDPLNIRYATDSTNMSLWTMHNAVRYAFIATAGPVIVFEFSDAEFLSAHCDVIDEIRPATTMHPFWVGSRVLEVAKRWADEIAALLDEHGGGGRRLAVDILALEGIRALEACGVDLVSGQPLMEKARLVKHEEEINAMRCAAHACQRNLDDMKAMLSPGVTEVALWARLQESNTLRFGEWIETRLLASGERTNPWFQEASSKVVKAGELIAFDTDLVGAYGMCIDMSRTWLCGGGAPSGAQQQLHDLASETVARNTELFKAGASLREVTEKLWYPPLDEYNGYTVMAHGTGLCDEYPSVYAREKWDSNGFDDIIPAGAVMSVEAFVGKRSGGEGVKLEQQIVVRESGPEPLTDYPLALR
ncbi:MAG: M24 family metallopeptidase [Gammaproteobacteria bacterium]|nr:M24 family metallopeptidase [Gammaproteobacteria bacterium]